SRQRGSDNQKEQRLSHGIARQSAPNSWPVWFWLWRSFSRRPAAVCGVSARRVRDRRGARLPPGELPALPGLLLKDSYWRRPERDLGGNTIDLSVKVLGVSFNDAMRQITG